MNLLTPSLVLSRLLPLPSPQVYPKLFSVKWSWIAWGVGLFFLLSCGDNPIQAKESKPRILLLCSYHFGDEWEDRVIQGIQEELATEKNDLLVEYLDFKREPGLFQNRIFHDLLELKYRNRPPSLIITADDTALDFLLAVRQDLFPDLPIVFCGINQFTPQRIQGQKGITGIVETPSYGRNLELALSLLPETRDAFVVCSDLDKFARGRLQVFRREALPYAGRIAIHEWLNLREEEVKLRMSSLPPHSILLHVSGLASPQGAEMLYADCGQFLRWMADQAPFFTSGAFFVEQGFLGGWVLSGREHGSLAGKIGLRILAGENPDQIPVILESPPIPMFNWIQLQRFGIRETSLPPDSIVINKPFSIYGAYRYWIWGTLLFILLETWIVIGLLISRARVKKAEAALKAKTEELDRFFNVNLDLFCIADTDGYFRRLNPEWEKTLGYKLEDLQGKKFLDFVHPDDLEPTLKAISRLDAQNPVLSFVNRYRCRDGSYRWIEWRSHPQGKVIYAAARDITERKSAEDHRLHLERQIQHTQKLESLGVLAGGIAHDFNNLLMAILGHLSLVLEDLPANSPVRASVEGAEKAALRAADLTRQLLAYSGKGRFVVQELDLSKLVEELVHLLKSSISKKGLLHLHLEQDLPLIKADSSQIQQVVMNLIVNASEAIGDRTGTISVSTGTRWCDQAYLSQSRVSPPPSEGLYAYLEVSDNGCGMDETTLQRLFDPFFSTKFTGRGLGMSAVLGIVRGHQGAIMVYTEPGKGTTFKILLPAVSHASAQKEPAAGLPAESNPPPKFSGKVLLVDDEEVVREVCQGMLRRLGFEVLVAKDGEEALKIYQRKSRQIDCVLLDLTMPNMDGVTTFHELKQIRPDVKVILSSGYNHQDVTQRFAGKGLAGFIQKPYQLSTLEAEFRRVLPSAHS